MKTSSNMYKILLSGVGIALSLVSITDLFRVINNDNRSPMFAWIQAETPVLIIIDAVLVVVGIGLIAYASRMKNPNSKNSSTDQ